MKTANTIFKLFIVSLVLMACSTEDPAELDSSLHQPEVEIPVVSAGTFTAKIDGQDYEIDIATATMANNVITISGKRGNEVVTLRMPSSIGTNSVTNPNILGGASDVYSAFYNTDITNSDASVITTSHATTKSDLNMTIDGVTPKWIADTPLADIDAGVTTIRGVKGANGESLNIMLQTDQGGSYVFGTINHTANYTEAGAGANVFEADTTVDNGAITLEVDDVNKLVSGTFSFDGTETYVPNVVVVDLDGDGVYASEDPNDNNPCVPTKSENYTRYDASNVIWQAGDCDNDGITNLDELNGPDGDITTTGDNTNPYEGNVDTDGDGVLDAEEDINDPTGVEKTDPCLPVQALGYLGFDSNNATWRAADCDGDGVLNGDEDTDGDGISNEDETTNGTDVDNPCDPIQAEGYRGYDFGNSTWANADCDNDTVSNGEEVLKGTDPYFFDFLTKQFTAGSFQKVPYDQPAIKRGLNVSTHDTAAKRIVGTYSFIAASIGEDPTKWYVITDGAFDVTYTVPE